MNNHSLLWEIFHLGQIGQLDRYVLVNFNIRPRRAIFPVVVLPGPSAPSGVPLGEEARRAACARFLVS